MKIILINGVYQKVTNEVADAEVRFGRAKFAPKSEWKKNVRDVQKSEEVKVATHKGEATKNEKREKREKLKAKQRPSEYTDKFMR
jgi:hypothetical protein